jgi:hypothetical protein
MALKGQCRVTGKIEEIIEVRRTVRRAPLFHQRQQLDAIERRQRHVESAPRTQEARP